MKVRLNYRGTIFLSLTVFFTILSVLLRSPPIILFATFAVGYLIGFPISVSRYEPPEIELQASFRHSLLYRGEVEIFKVSIINHSNSLLPLVKVAIGLPYSVYLVDRPSEFVFSLNPHSEVTINLPLLPTARGSYAVGPIRVTTGDPFFLFETEIAKIEEVPFRIFPKRLGKKISKTKSREVFSNLIGLFATRRRGIGTDFHGLREYIRGDPVKIIDWAATAKNNKLISREYEEEKKLEVMIVIASGTTMRGSKFDFALGAAMDLFDGITQENHPVGLMIFDNDILAEFAPSPSTRRKLQIWSQIYDIVPRDIYPDYNVLDNWVSKRGMTSHLFLVIGDLEYDTDAVVDSMRNIRLRQNNVIFFDIFGYPFSYQDELNDAAADLASDNYGIILSNVIGNGIIQEHIMRGFQIKKELLRFFALYAFLEDQNDNVVNSLERTLYAYFGKNWRSMNT